ncbi:putative mitochondrial outer membrane protein, partial [Elaphomyces granulatus]
LVFRALSRPKFAVLQSAIFPIYFTPQTALPVVFALDFPGMTTTSGAARASPSSNQLSTLLPLITVCVANLLLLSPRSALTRRSTCSFETIDGKKSYDDPPHTNRVIRLDKMFRKLHGYSPMVNLVALVA